MAAIDIAQVRPFDRAVMWGLWWRSAPPSPCSKYWAMRRGTSDRTAGAHHRAPLHFLFQWTASGRLRPELL